MAKFFLKKLTISGENKTPSFVEFGEGLNIVYGLSDTGKTCIVKCIDFVFGSKKGEPIPVSHGYDVIELLIETDGGSLTLERKIGKNKIKVSSTDPAFESGEYPHYNSSGGDIGELLLGLLGIADKPKIIKNGNYDRVRLTWQNLLYSVLINEEEVLQSPPILIAKESTAQTSSLSALLYLAAAPDFSQINPVDDKKIREARKRAVEKYIGEEIESLKKRRTSLDERLKSIDPQAAENAIQGLVDELAAIETRIAAEVVKSKGTLAKILAERDRLDECDLLLRSYAELHSQYTADIKRLSFIVDGEISLGAVPAPNACPFCDGEIPEANHESYIEVSNAELARIVRLIVEKNPNQLKFAQFLWDLRAVKLLIEQKFGKRLGLQTVWTYLDNWGMSSQKPLKRSYKQNEEALKKFTDIDFPAIKKRAKEENAEIFFADETGIYTNSFNPRGFAPKGKPPVCLVETKKEKVNMLAAISANGHRRFMLYEERTTQQKLIELMTNLIKDQKRRVRRKVFLFLDNLPVHHGGLVKEFLEKNKDKIEVFYFPSYAPELNPDEYLNNILKQDIRSGIPPRDIKSIKEKATNFMKSLIPRQIKKLFQHPKISYVNA